MNHLGISCGFHDAAMSVIDDKGDILFAGHSERYSKKKHDPNLCSELIHDAMTYMTDEKYTLNYYERPYIKAIRQFRAGQDIGPLSVKRIIGPAYEHFDKRLGSIKTNNHHLCHAAGGFQTSPYEDATVIVIDAIGELDTMSIYDARYDKNGNAKYTKLWGKRYPDSIGLMYSAMTDRVGLRPLDEEYILMGMAAYGRSVYHDEMYENFISDLDSMSFKQNLHTGVSKDFLIDADDMDIAASTQSLTELLLRHIFIKAKALSRSNNLVYSGGVALNCLANRLIGKYFDNIWIMPNPGDAGNSLGAAALKYGKRLNWKDGFLGHDIVGKYPVDSLLAALDSKQIVGVANGRAEFGPRALGNRSLLADPRGQEIKDRVNEIKRRQKFRPFAPVILEELCDLYFDMPKNWNDSRYMQVISTCKNIDLFPAIAHHDGTSRVQTVPADGSGIRKLLEAWYAKTRCPMLLNTSLNIRGEPMVNDRHDADRFEKLYGVPVYS